jgi:Predicted membrane protein
MSSLTVGKYATADGAAQSLETLFRARDEGLIKVYDGMLVTWQPGRKRPMTRPILETRTLESLDPAFWGILMGLLFFVPPEAANVDPSSQALHGILTHVGIDADFINQARHGITEGTSAVFLYSEAMDLDAVARLAAHTGVEMIATTMPPERAAHLREIFGSQ